MKTQLRLISRVSCVAIAASVFCLADAALAQGTTAGRTDQNAQGGAPSNSTKEPMGQKGVTASTVPAGASQIDPKDEQFLMTASRGNKREIHMGQMAQDQGTSNEVKKLGRMMITDHGNSDGEIKGLASRKNVKLEAKPKMDKMNLGRENFDQQWLAMMVQEHQKTIREFQGAAKSAKDPDVRNFAKKTLPVLQRHLSRLQDAQKTMGNANANANT